MNPANKTSSGVSATTSTKSVAGEAEYLHRQSALALKAMAQTAGALADDVRQLAAPINWARRYPKTAVGVAVAAGAMVGIMAGRQPKRPAAAQAQPANPPPPADKAKTTLLGMLMVELLAIAKPMISELLTRAVKSPDRQHDNDGN